MSTLEEAQKFLKFIRHCFIESSSNVTQKTTSVENQSVSIIRRNGEKPALHDRDGVFCENVVSQRDESQSLNRFTLKSICLYPIKSCAAFEVGAKCSNDFTVLIFCKWILLINISLAVLTCGDFLVKWWYIYAMFKMVHYGSDDVIIIFGPPRFHFSHFSSFIPGR